MVIRFDLCKTDFSCSRHFDEHVDILEINIYEASHFAKGLLSKLSCAFAELAKNNSPVIFKFISPLHYETIIIHKYVVYDWEYNDQVDIFTLTIPIGDPTAITIKQSNPSLEISTFDLSE